MASRFTQLASRSELAFVSVLLLMAGAAFYGPHVVEGGFTIDDWGHAIGVQHPREGLLQDYWQVTPNRPLSVVYFPLTYLIMGPDPALHLAWSILLAVTMSVLLYALLRRLDFLKLHAGAIALLVLLFPWSDSTRFWASAAHSSLAIALALAGVLLALRGLDARAEGRIRAGGLLHVGAVTLYALSVLLYETAGAALLLVGALYLTRATWRAVRYRWLADISVIAGCLAWNASSSGRERRQLAEMLDQASAVSDGARTVIALAAVPFGSPDRQVVLAALAAVVAAAVVVRLVLPRTDSARTVLTRWIVVTGAGLAIAAAAWVLFVPADPYYNPAQPGVGNRVNAMAAIGVVIAIYGSAVLAATLLCRWLPRGRLAAAGLTGILAASLVFGYAREVRDDQQAWARAATTADRVLTAVRTAIPDPPERSTIYTFGHPGSERPGVVIFSFSWDLAGGVRLTYDDPSLNAYPVLADTTIVCEKERLGPTAVTGENSWTPDLHGAPYQTAYFVDVRSSTAQWVDSRRTCENARPRFQPGPIVRVP
jgi:hypothetical protein